ncbi:Sugar fermentation stimulation protein-like protein [Frankliniella fusca]|uniref:Sugar fermentation stimulation protein-like protein n=1 Tax=Frankliniella fusca TaxID=407009 RepID=A0AAE1H8J0_9NEOP|nr:Sugar fermentation stimulation protein-like protein [Frankliniella fusca]
MNKFSVLRPWNFWIKRQWKPFSTNWVQGSSSKNSYSVGNLKERITLQWHDYDDIVLSPDDLTRVAAEIIIEEFLNVASQCCQAATHSNANIDTAAGTVIAEMLGDGSVSVISDSVEVVNNEHPSRSNEEAERPSKKRIMDRSSLYDLDLARLCGSCVNGKCVIRYYKLHSDLNESNRNLLADIILNDYLKDDASKRLPPDVESAMADSVVSLFPTEKKDVWASVDGKKRSSAAGRMKLLTRYYDIRRRMSKSGLLSKSTDNTEEPSHSDGNEGSDDEENVDSQLGDHLIWLQNNKQPWSKVSSLWELTSKLRMRRLMSRSISVGDYLTKYPALQDPSGYLLLATDFELKYPASTMSLFLEWPQLVGFIESIVPNKDEIEESLSEDGKKIRIIQSLPFLFPVITCAKKGKKQWRPSRQESAEALMLHVKSLGDINISLASRAKDKYEPYQLSLGAQAIVVGPDLDTISNSFVRINSTMYEVENPLKALDVTFKVMHALDCKYHKESEREWFFLEKAVYKLNPDKSAGGKVSSAVKSYMDFKKRN